jgi:hypothetical protein
MMIPVVQDRPTTECPPLRMAVCRWSAVDPDRRGDVRGVLHSATAAGLVFSNRAIEGLRADSQSGAPGKTTLPAIAACGASQSAVILDVGILVAAEDGVGEEPAGLRLGAVRIGEAVVLGQQAR